jgi:hypothetical protein
VSPAATTEFMVRGQRVDILASEFIRPDFV